MEESIRRKRLKGECLKAKELQFSYGKKDYFSKLESCDACKELVHRNSNRFTKCQRVNRRCSDVPWQVNLSAECRCP